MPCPHPKIIYNVGLRSAISIFNSNFCVAPPNLLNNQKLSETVGQVRVLVYACHSVDGYLETTHLFHGEDRRHNQISLTVAVVVAASSLVTIFMTAMVTIGISQLRQLPRQ